MSGLRTMNSGIEKKLSETVFIQGKYSANEQKFVDNLRTKNWDFYIMWSLAKYLMIF